MIPLKNSFHVITTPIASKANKATANDRTIKGNNSKEVSFTVDNPG